jgi:hypothetical protein
MTVNTYTKKRSTTTGPRTGIRTRKDRGDSECAGMASLLRWLCPC